ncbi:DNA-(apurinic or apyrimidinic site) endonuclease-like isoform X2 [Anopheles arabiensis]|uniref:DNA-(apurinic or apyrimidinic site) endonuclease-like isoform X2 n=1 Tax=Anopheles arabiensis TaxID=7173 RepID=UPI001AACB147|nr:DNA-(apurinic or apyrimidinic site) endonuclease-like isoform X2 [Anopheles arabiensis]
MEEKPKKRGRQPRGGAKETAVEAEKQQEQLTEPDQMPADPLKARGGSKRKAIVPEPAPAVEKAPRKPAAKRTKAADVVLESNGVEENGAKPNGEVMEKAVPAKKGRSTKKEAVPEQEASSNGTVEDVKAKGKKAPAKRETKATKASKTAEEPAAAKRGRTKASTKKEEKSEKAAPAKPKGRGKVKDKADGGDDVSERKPVEPEASSAIKSTTMTAKPALKGKKKAAEDTGPVSNAPESPPSKAVERPKRTRRAIIPRVADNREALEEAPKKVTKKKALAVVVRNGVTQRKRVKPQPPAEEMEEDEEETAPSKGMEAKAALAAAAGPKMNKSATNYGELNFALEEDKPWNFKISSWNVAALRSWVGKGGLEFLEHEKPDILCVQETRCTEDQMPDEARHIKGYHPYWLCKPGGRAGVAIYSKKMAFHVAYGLGDEEQDQDGRLLTAEYEKFYLVCVYVPNAGRKLDTLRKRLRWNEKFHQYLRDLDAKKPVILCGDMNVAHEEIDLANPKTNKKKAGFTPEEREGMTELLSYGFVDTFRKLYPDRTGAYTFWTYMRGARAKNMGWRLDYFITSERLAGKVTDNVVRSQVFGSDHCPVTLFLNI